LKNHDLKNASKHAKNAIVASESAFFDKTMVSMLYLPSEHIYAMYMPFFVPALIPIVGLLREEFIKWKSLSKVKVE
jgi:phosphatidylinositol glycan class S